MIGSPRNVTVVTPAFFSFGDEDAAAISGSFGRSSRYVRLTLASQPFCLPSLVTTSLVPANTGGSCS